MRVRCVALLPTPEQGERLRPMFHPGKQEFGLELGREYLVLGLAVWDGEPWVQIPSKSGYVLHVPLCLFEVVDGRIPALWVLRVSEDGSFTLWPPSFYREYYFDDLIEGVPSVSADFRQILLALAKAPE